jgi:hypothetical protein
VPKVADQKKAAAIEVQTGQPGKATTEGTAVLPSPKKQKANPPALQNEPEANAAKKEAEQKKAEKKKKLLDLKMAEMFHPDALAKLVRDKQYTGQMYYVAIRKPEQKTNKQTNQQTNKKNAQTNK